MGHERRRTRGKQERTIKREGQEVQDRKDSSWPKWQGYIGMRNWENRAPGLHFRAGGMVRRAKRRWDASTAFVTANCNTERAWRPLYFC